MPDTSADAIAHDAEMQASLRAVEPRPPWRWASPLLRRILLVNLVPLALLLAALLYLDQYQNGLLEAEVGTLREQARIYAGALGEAATEVLPNGDVRLLPAFARDLLLRLTEPSPNAEAKLYAPDGQVVADSRVRPDSGGAMREEPLPPPPDRGQVVGAIGHIYDRVLSLLPHNDNFPTLDTGPSAVGPEWQPDVRQEVRLTGSDQSREMPPYIRRTDDGRLLVTVAEPVERAKHTVGIVLLTREAREVDESLMDVRLSILGLFGFALGLTVLMSWYLSLTIARPILRLARAAEQMQEGRGRAGTVPRSLLARHDEVGELAAALERSARALWDRMDAIERFAADVAHEIKNPLSSIRSAIETWRRIDDPEKQRRLLAIVGEDVGRLDRLISDISDASRIDAELSRLATSPVDVAPILVTLADIHDATRHDGDPPIALSLPEGKLVVQAVEGRLVQVLRNLIANARSFSPPGGCIGVVAREAGGVVQICVEDDGPGIPEAKLEHVFDRFYSERPQGEGFGQHSGLGLSISRQIAEALKGTLVAGNRRDERGRVLGARFVLSLPAVG
jgi:two-component system sensor histidine kinase ChvG